MESIYTTQSPDKVLEDAHEVVVKTLKEHVVPTLDPDVLKRGNEIVKAYDKSPPK
jgi:trimethylamine:corrinoid methyltransferase-like protein